MALRAIRATGPPPRSTDAQETRSAAGGADGDRQRSWNASLRGGALCLRMGRDDITHCGLHAALFDRNAGERERHFGPCERTQDRQIIGIAEMANAEILAAERPEAGAVGNVEVIEGEIAHLVGIMA